MTEVAGSQQMSALVVYESMYGNTGSIAHAIAEGVEKADDTRGLCSWGRMVSLALQRVRSRRYRGRRR